MVFPKVNPTQTNSYKSLELHFQKIKNISLKELFDIDSSRFDEFSIKWNDFVFDFSKNHINRITKKMLLDFFFL